MGWLIYRIAAAVLALLVGGWVGAVVGRSTGAPIMSVLVGGAIGVAAMVAWDGLRGHALIEWLRGAQDADAPRSAGFWRFCTFSSYFSFIFAKTGNNIFLYR